MSAYSNQKMRPRILHAMILLLVVVLFSCEKPKPVKVNSNTGGLTGEFLPNKSGVKIFLCKINQGGQDCTLQAQLTDITDESGRYGLSEIPPGAYVILYALPEEVSNLKLSGNDVLPFSYSLTKSQEIKKRFWKEEKWVTASELSSDNYMIMAGAETGAGFTDNRIMNASLKHGVTGLRAELRNRAEFLSIEISPNKVSQKDISPWEAK